MTDSLSNDSDLARFSTAPDFVRLSELLTYVGGVLERGIPGYVWVSAEIGSVSDRRHLFMELLELGEDGVEIARSRATLFMPERARLEGRFLRRTGSRLESGLSVLLAVKPTFHPQYGFALNVLDIVPAFTLGAAQQKLEESRAALEREGLLALQKGLPLPEDFVRVAVLSPAQAAGLGDFQATLRALEAAGVCAFHYFEAVFQGQSAPGSMRTALERIRREHAVRPFDALCVIRGGGSSLDLAWLSDLELARSLARMPLPVLTGIGHARDDTLLDDVAALRLDTPSKVAAFVFGRIAGRAEKAERDYRTVRRVARGVLREAQGALERRYARIHREARGLLERRERELDALMRRVLGLHPRQTLRRGYAVVRAGGAVLTSAGRAAQESALEVEFQDGTLEVRP